MTVNEIVTQLTAQNTLMNALLTHMPAMVFAKDAETGVYLACNQSFAEYAHRDSPDGVVGLTDFDIFDEVTATHFVEDDKKALAMEDAHIFIEDVPDAVGNPRHFQTTKVKFTDETGRLCSLGLCVDVTVMTRVKTAETEGRVKQQELQRRKNLQEQLIEEEQMRLEQDKMITALASDYRCVYHVDLDADDAVCYRADPTDMEQTPEGVHFPFRERFTWYAHHSVAESYREGFLDFIDPEHIRSALGKNPIIVYRYLAQRAGKEYYEMIRMAGVCHAEDRADSRTNAVGLGLTVIDEEMRDSLAKKQALVEALAAAEEANKAKTSFLSNMSHEIRTPMNAIIGLDNIALQDASISASTRDYLEKIGNSANHLLRLINDILDMSRIESGRMTLKNEEFSFTGMMDQLRTLLQSQCSEKGLSFECRVIGRVDERYIGDDMKLKQVLINILSNACKFTDAPGSVTFTVEQTARFENNSTLRFAIRDTGIGMDKEYLPKIFDAFSQENAGRSNKYGSTGLGMAITKNIVEMMNGSIAVTSEKGVGSEFVVTVTLRNADRKEVSSEVFNPKDLRVLIIDDDPVACEHARLVLDEVAVTADTCTDGEEALKMVEVHRAKREPYNLILMDWQMPEKDGVEVTREIRARYDDEATIIILTAYQWDGIEEEARKAGVDGFMAKPLFASDVLAAFEQIVRRKNVSVNDEAEPAELTGKRILLAEDMFINAEIMKQILGMREMLVDHAENGEIALQMFAGSEPGYYDAILMDVRMPVMDGLAAAAAIRALPNPDAKTVPIIALTANAFDEDVQRSLQAGMNAHLNKPVEPEQLFRKLGSLIRK